MRHNTLYLLLITTIVLSTNYLTAQQNNFNKEFELKKFVERGEKVEELSPKIYRLSDRTGESRTFYLNSKTKTVDNTEPVDTTIIKVWEIDTTLYNNKFTFWQKVEVANSWWAPLPIDDLNNNSRPELYGYTDIIYPNTTGPVKIFEQNTSGIYQDIFTYDSSTVYVKGITHIHPNCDTKIFTNAFIDEDSISYNIYPIYKNDTAGTLPTKFDTYFYIDTLQINNMAFGDFDKNGITDCAFTTPSVEDTTMIAIAEYRDSINNFEEVFRYSSIFESDISGIAMGDFDLDGKTELVISSGPGNVFVIENIRENQYSIVNKFPFPVHNTYMQTVTSDIDGNGKPEFWIGGQDYENGITVIQCYEFDGDNNYQVVAYIELRYLVSLFNEYIQAVDIDDDRKEELIISIGNDILILKFGGYPNNHQYKLWYVKHGEATQPGAGFYPVAVADLDGDGEQDLLIPMEKYTPWITYNFSYILTQEASTDVNDFQKPKIEFELIQNYPNPFNPNTTIEYQVSEVVMVSLKVFDILGREIATLVNEEKPNGSYEVKFDGGGLISGIYFYRLQAGSFVETKKMILMK